MSRYRIMKGHKSYFIQQKGWIFWINLTKWESHYIFQYRRWFDTIKEAEEYIRKIETYNTIQKTKPKMVKELEFKKR